MRCNLLEEEVDQIVDLLVNKYELSTYMINKLYGNSEKDATYEVLNNVQDILQGREGICRLLVLREGINLFTGGSEEKRELRKKILDQLPDEIITNLYSKYEDKTRKISTVGYMKSALVKRKWHSGKRWAVDFIAASGFPKILAGISNTRDQLKSAIEIIEPKKTIPVLVPYQEHIKKQIVQILAQQGGKTRCMISLPTGGGKTRVAVEAFLDWMEPRFEERKYMLWIAQSEELCEQCISCIEQMWKSREFILPLKIYRLFSKYDFSLDELEGGVVIASINKIYNKIKVENEVVDEILTNTGAMIIDEAHRASTAMYDALFERASMLTNNQLFSVCGLSATPGRNTIISDNEVDKLVNRFQMNLITPEFNNDEKYKDNPLAYFKEQKYLAKVNHIIFKSGREYKLTEAEVNELNNKGEYAPSFLKKLANDMHRNTKIINRLREIKSNTPTLVYACTVEHARFLATILNALGRRAAFIDSSTNKMERRIIIKQFTEGSIEFLLNYGVLTTGFDAPKTRMIVICRPINSNILYEQIVGRGIRGVRFGGTEECDVIDFSDNILNLGRQQAFMRFKEYWDQEADE